MRKRGPDPAPSTTLGRIEIDGLETEMEQRPKPEPHTVFTMPTVTIGLIMRDRGDRLTSNKFRDLIIRFVAVAFRAAMLRDAMSAKRPWR